MHVSKKQQIFILISVIVSFTFLMLFSYSTSFLYPKIVGFDSGYFKLVGLGMNNGLLPYKDFFDMKGPLLFMLEAFGQFIYNGDLGVFIIQLVNLSIIVYCSLELLEFLAPKIKSFDYSIFLMILFIFLFIVFDEGNLTEEFSMSFCMISLLLYLKYENNIKLVSFVLGLSFFAILFIRVTNSVIICSIELLILIKLICNKQWKYLLIHIKYCTLGALFVIVPIILYCILNGILYDMLYCVFIFGSKYALEDNSISLNYMLLIPLLLYIFNFKNNSLKENVVFIIASLVTIFVLTLGNNYIHYYVMLYPLYVLLLISIIKNVKIKKICFLTFVLLLLATKIITPLTYFADRLFNNNNSMNALYDDSKDIFEYIEKDEEIFSYGIDTPFYYINKVFPSNKYAFWQDHYIELSSDIKYEIINEIIVDRPKYLLLKNKYEINEEIFDVINQNYYLKVQNNSFILMESK